MLGIGSTSDPYRMTEGEIPPSNRNTRNKTIRANPRLIDGERTLVLILWGQSLIANYDSALYTPTNPSKIDNLNIFDGGVYAAELPLLGTDGPVVSPGVTVGVGGNYAFRLADKAISNNEFDRVVLVPAAVGGASLSQLGVGGVFNLRLRTAFARCAALGLPATAVLYQQGEADAALGTSQAAWQAAFNAMVGAEVARGNNVPWFVAKSTMVTNVVSPTMQAAIDGVVNGVNIFAGPNTDSLTGVTNRHDGTHLTGAGSDANATMALASIAAVL